jgi:lipopolysaccharide biosynthesis protein
MTNYSALREAIEWRCVRYWGYIRRRPLPKTTGRCRERHADFSVAVPLAFPFDRPDFSEPIAVVCHIFNVDLADEIYLALSNIPMQNDLFISTDTSEKALMLRQKFSAWKLGSVNILVVENRGRDIAPKYISFRDVYDRYELILFIHSKKTKQLPTQADWRRLLINTLTGSPQIVASILWMFKKNEKLGIVFPQHYEPIRPYINWGGLFPQAKRLARKIGVELQADQLIDFAAGSMFWARGDALRPILDLGLTFEHFPNERGQVHGTIAHVLERLLLYGCEKAGYKWLKVSQFDQCDAPETVVSINKPGDFDDFITKHGVTLSSSSKSIGSSRVPGS